VEPVFGIIKQVMGFRRFLLRGIERVKGSDVGLASNASWALPPAFDSPEKLINYEFVCNEMGIRRINRTLVRWIQRAVIDDRVAGHEGRLNGFSD